MSAAIKKIAKRKKIPSQKPKIYLNTEVSLHYKKLFEKSHDL